MGKLSKVFVLSSLSFGVLLAACDGSSPAIWMPDSQSAGDADSGSPSKTDHVWNDEATLADSGSAPAKPDPLFAIGGSVAGLHGKGLVLLGASGEEVAVDADGAFVFETKQKAGSPFAVSVKSQPSEPKQTCHVSGGEGKVVAGDVSSIAVTCSDDLFTVGGTVQGLEGKGLILKDKSGAELAVNATSFAFPRAFKDGEEYEVSIVGQPVDPSQECELEHGSGKVTAADVATLGIVCKTSTFEVRGHVSGYKGKGLILKNNGADDFQAIEDGVFAFSTKVASGASYKVTVGTQPSDPVQLCSISHDEGRVGASDIDDVQVDCTTEKFKVGVSVAGLGAHALTLQNNGGDDLVLSADGTAWFTAAVESGQPYGVTVSKQPAGYSCKVTSGSGTVVAADVNVSVTCELLTCGNGVLEPGEDIDPPPTGAVTAVDPLTCRWAFDKVEQLYCAGSCTWAGDVGCDQADADVFCKLRTGNPLSKATSFVVGRALDKPGFSCPFLGTSLGTMPARGVNRDVRYQDSSILESHGAGEVIVNPVCTNP